MRVDKIVSEDLRQRGDILLRHRTHPLTVKFDDFLRVSGHFLTSFLEVSEPGEV
jgi:hypothetical protein